MISIEDLVGLVKTGIPDAEVDVMDKTGMRDHFIIYVTSGKFKEMDVMSRHRAVQATLTSAMQDGRIHAAEIKTAVP
ncbi:MAG: BolA family transcriptional regulator [Nitrospinae bacterium CG11_big_fil_rev_8_21_14_0_20_56_8]|nr:MAG: BolA family transcriptional regulator [Nitrospinae bacterium CG11_big_fil_rev_8_21_14_0_20_56_8]